MSFIAVVEEELRVGEPLRWTLYGWEEQVLLEAGQVIESAEQLQALLQQKIMRKAEDNGEPGDESPALADPVSSDESHFVFADMRLRVGDRIQLQPPATVGLERYMVRLIGYMENASLLVSAPVAANGVRAPMREGDKIVARVFSSQKAFAFDSSVTRVCNLPYHYLHLSFPDTIQGAVIRKSPRIRTQIIASISAEAGEGGDKQSGVIVNLSVDGALVKSRQALFEKGQTLHLSFRLT